MVRRAVAKRGAQHKRARTACVLKFALVEVTRVDLIVDEGGEKHHERWGAPVISARFDQEGTSNNLNREVALSQSDRFVRM